MKQLQIRNPQAANQISQAISNNANPQDLMKQMMNSMNNSQIQQVMLQARNLGVPNNILSQIQNMK